MAPYLGNLVIKHSPLSQYIPIPTIGHEALDKELFCSIYYLRNLCNEDKFPDWSIDQPVKLLKDCLENWYVVRYHDNIMVTT